MSDSRRADDSVRAGLVVYHHLLVYSRRKLQSHQPSNTVRVAPCAPRHDQPDRSGWELVGLCGSRQKDGRQQGAECEIAERHGGFLGSDFPNLVGSISIPRATLSERERPVTGFRMHYLSRAQGCRAPMRPAGHGGPGFFKPEGQRRVRVHNVMQQRHQAPGEHPHRQWQTTTNSHCPSVQFGHRGLEESRWLECAAALSVQTTSSAIALHI
ncbi:hypothetical protein D3C87_1216560 [compost metagenome]